MAKHSEAAKAKLRASWTAERRAAQAERARRIPREAKANRTGRRRSPEAIEMMREAARAQWTPERRRAAPGIE